MQIWSSQGSRALNVGLVGRVQETVSLHHRRHTRAKRGFRVPHTRGSRGTQANLENQCAREREAMPAWSRQCCRNTVTSETGETRSCALFAGVRAGMESSSRAFYFVLFLFWRSQMHPDRGRWGSTTTVHGGTAEIPESAEARNRM